MTAPNPAAVPLIDRQAELGWLEAIAGEVREAASGRLVTVVGPRGVGKSRVVGAFADWCAERSITVLSAHCVGRAAEPLLPIRDALRPILGTNARAVRAALRRSAPDLLEGVPVLGKFLAGLGRELSAGPQIGPRSLYDVLASVMVRLGSRTGLCLIIEDAHVADPDTLNFLTYLVNKSRDCPSLTIVTLPAEERMNPAIADCLSEWEERGSETLTVRPFERAYVGEYLAAVLPTDAIDDSTLDFMFSFTGGNPLLLSESIRQLVDKEGAVARLAGGASEVPERIRQLLERRVQRLDERTRSFMDAAAVVAETSHELSPILHLLDLDDRSGLATLNQACDAGVISESEDGRISFTSELLRMVTYARLRPNQRRSLHLRAGQWFDEQQQFSEAAHHYERAEDWRRLLPAAFRAAEAAEHVGLYQAAVSWYRRVQARAEPADLFPRLARALMVVGNWADAERLLGALPSNDPRTLLLRSRLCFVRGDVTGAADHATLALDNGAAEDIDVLLHLANIYLYTGEFAQATVYADRALQAARTSGSINGQARCHIVRGACQLYSGDPRAAELSFQDGIWLLDSRSPDSRDVGVYSALLGNRGYVEEVEQRWWDAERSHREALRLRREVADAVGVLESTLAIGRAALGKGELRSAREHLTEALHLAEDLGEELQQAKIIHAMGELATRTGDVEAARDLVEDARSRFVKCGTPYDVAYTDLSLAAILGVTGRRESIERLATARAAVERKGFALLRRLFPELEPALRDRVHAGLLAYAGGDALGLPWEGSPPQEVRMQELDALPAREAWPSGSTSDDTALTLLVAEHLAQAGGLGDPLRFLEMLASRSESIRGLGPSTRRAIEHFTATGTPDDSGSNTNGAPMRALPIGWALPASADDRRREWTLALTRMTHTGRDALTAACVMAACASWAIEGAPPSLLVQIAADEAAATGNESEVASTITALREGRWTPPSQGISLAPDETVAAVLHCCETAEGDLVEALRLAVSLGGDTDTVAGLVGGLLGCRFTPAEINARLSWLDRVALPRPDDLSRLASALTAIRLAVGE
jgi:ADP-ribosylglycohydrolase/tetratricopeptide (TPR) repeat protein